MCCIIQLQCNPFSNHSFAADGKIFMILVEKGFPYAFYDTEHNWTFLTSQQKKFMKFAGFCKRTVWRFCSTQKFAPFTRPRLCWLISACRTRGKCLISTKASSSGQRLQSRRVTAYSPHTPCRSLIL